MEGKSPFDLEERTFAFARDVRALVKTISKESLSWEDIRQVTRSSGSVAANYIEANESLSKKDFVLRIKICRKEAKETKLWLSLLRFDLKEEREQKRLIQESTELVKIFNAIVNKNT